MKFDNMVELIKLKGFKIVYEANFGECPIEREVIFCQEEYGMILYLVSKNFVEVANAFLYAEVTDAKFGMSLNWYFFHENREYLHLLEANVTDNFSNRYEILIRKYHFSPHWKKKHLISLANYLDIEKNRNSKVLRRVTIMKIRLSEELKMIVGEINYECTF